MKIQQMFAKDIDRKINGVIKVSQDDSRVVEQEVEEYVITKELRKHFAEFLGEFSKPAQYDANTGVWISGFFGSGKSHFLKMLSYIMENRMVSGRGTIDYFMEKTQDMPKTQAALQKLAQLHTQTILFNIDIVGPMDKGKMAVPRVFAKMFYNMRGFYGDDLKVAHLEEFLEKQGKLADFEAAFESKNGLPWKEQRSAFAFFEDDVEETLQDVLGMSKQAAERWFLNEEFTEGSIDSLIDKIRDYVNQQPENYRLVFLIDEVGQYIGGDGTMLLNLQSIIEDIDSKCGGKVWVLCTGQEAIDEIIKVASDEFSKIQARFHTRLSLSSLSVDEVIERRILEKTPEAERVLESVYEKHEPVLRNLFTFDNAALDIKGFEEPAQFVKDFPFVPYQFILMPKVFSAIRKHGNAGKHLSGGERSMLSGFQEAAQQLEHRDEMTLIPFYKFYDTVHTFLDGAIRRVIDRCQNIVDKGAGLENQDVDVLKLLYLVRYLDASNEIKANLDNLVILMADNINIDKIGLRVQVKASLDRLLAANYIARNGDRYTFLTDEEQDVQADIRNTTVESTAITQRLGELLYESIYTAKKVRYNGVTDFGFNRYVDATAVGNTNSDLLNLYLLTVDTDETEKQDFNLILRSNNHQALVALADTAYYEDLRQAMQIRRYIQQHNISTLPRTVQNIIRNQQDEAKAIESGVVGKLERAIVEARFYACGQKVKDIKKAPAGAMLDAFMTHLIGGVYSKLHYIDHNLKDDSEILAILQKQDGATLLPGQEPNRQAADAVMEFLKLKLDKGIPVSMEDVQKHFSVIPYGWREIDIAGAVALLVAEQKISVKRAGLVMKTDDVKMPDYLRKGKLIATTMLERREVVSQKQLRELQEFMRECTGQMSIPADEDGLVQCVTEYFGAQLEDYNRLYSQYFANKAVDATKYPGGDRLDASRTLLNKLHAERRENVALIKFVLAQQDELLERQEQMEDVLGFFHSQVGLFNTAITTEKELRDEQVFFDRNSDFTQAMNGIRQTTYVGAGKPFNYRAIKNLNGYLQTVHAEHDALLARMREEKTPVLDTCLDEVVTFASTGKAANDIRVQQLKHEYSSYMQGLHEKLQQTGKAMYIEMYEKWALEKRDHYLGEMEKVLTPPPPPKPVVQPAPAATGGAVKPQPPVPPQPPRKVHKVTRRELLVSRKLSSQQDVDSYVELLRTRLQSLLKQYDDIEVQ